MLLWSFLGEVPYLAALDLQQRLHARVLDSPDVGYLPLLTHPHVYTTGRRDAAECLLVSPERLAAEDAEFIRTDRGGLATYHGPGQLVGYPIVHLGRLGVSGAREYVRRLEEVMIRACARYGASCVRREEARGVYVTGGPGAPWRKIGAVGVNIRRETTTHGFALNLDPDLNRFNRIIPCGLRDSGVTSLQDLGIAPPAPADAATVCAREFGLVFGCEAQRVEPDAFYRTASA